MTGDKTAILIAKQNDEFRQGMKIRFGGVLIEKQTNLNGSIVITNGIHSLDKVERDDVFSKVENFSEFSPDNDPYMEHDFGSFEQGANTIFWKIDYYDNALEMHSPDKSDPSKTHRVLTIMLAKEW